MTQGRLLLRAEGNSLLHRPSCIDLDCAQHVIAPDEDDAVEQIADRTDVIGRYPDQIAHFRFPREV